MDQDGNQVPTGDSNQSNSGASGTGQQLDPAKQLELLQSRIDAFEKQLRGQQKGTDKEIGRVKAEVNDISGKIGRILELNGKGLDQNAIERELKLDALVGTESPAPAAPAPDKAVSGQSLDADSLLSTLKFVENDPALAALKIKYAGDPQSLVKAAADLRIQQLTIPPAGPAGALLPQGGTSPVGPDMQAKIDELAKLQKTPTQNREAIKKLKAELGW